ncbi:MAG: glycosyltransferase [Lachnospiraceae bacterium]|nr:glycosyltransferase [Lachnospiraceae bacterium]
MRTRNQEGSKLMISVAVVTYNGEKYLRPQLDSILSQLDSGDQVVVSDDGSKDSTREILKDYAGRDARVQLVDGPGQGVIANVECALKNCRGDYIFLADQDDVWAEDKVQVVMETFQSTGAMLVMHDARVVDQDCKKVLMPSFFSYRHSKKGAVKNIIKNSYMGCCMAFRRQVLEQVIPIPRDIQMHDQWIGVKCDLKYHRTVLLAETLLDYRRHEDNVSDFGHNTPWVMIKNRLKFLNRLLNRGMVG